MFKRFNLLKQHFENTTKNAIITALALVIALAWQDAIKAAVESFLVIMSLTEQGLFYKTISAVIISVICSVAILWLSRKVKNHEEPAR